MNKKKSKPRNPMYDVKHRSWSSNVHKSKKAYNRKRDKKEKERKYKEHY